MKKLATLFLGAAAVMSAAAADYTVTPAEGWPGKTLGSFTITFSQPVTVSDDSGISVDYNLGTDVSKTGVTGGMSLAADGNSLTCTFTRGDIYVGKKQPFASQSYKPGSTTVREGGMDFHINAGAYTVGGADGAELTISYFISDTPQINATFFPAPGEVESLGTITVSFGEGNVAAWGENPSASLYRGGSVNANPNYTYAVVDGLLTLTPAAAVTTPGSYELTVAAGSYTVNGEAGPELKAEYSIPTPPAPPAEDFAFTAQPSTAAWQEALGTVTLTFDGEVTIAEGFVKAVQYDFPGNLYTNNNFASETTFDGVNLGNGLHADGNKLFFANATTGGIRQGWTPFSGYGTLQPGFLTLYIREGSYFVNGVPGKEIVLNYYISDDAPAFFTVFDATPEDGDEIEKLDTITLEFIEEDVDITLEGSANGSITRDGEPVDAMVVVTREDEITLNVTVTPAQTAAGEYEVTIPEGAFQIQGIDNTPVVVTYTIADDQSGVEGLRATEATVNVYDLQGRKVSEETKGIRIVNGKKSLNR